MAFSDLKKYKPDWLLLALAIIGAYAMWYIVSQHERIVTQIEVNIDYVGIPNNLIVTKGLVSKVIVHLRGPETLLRSQLKHPLTKTIDLSHIKAGVEDVPFLNTDFDSAFRAYEIIDIQPPKLQITSEKKVDKVVPLRTEIQSQLGDSALIVEKVGVTPTMVTLRGPESILADIPSLPVIIRPDPRTTGKRDEVVPLDTPSFVSATPSTVRINYTITSERVKLSLMRKIEVAEVTGQNFTIEPAEITLDVEVPEALAKNRTYLRGLQVYAVPKNMEEGQSATTKLQVSLPEGMTLISPINREVIITRTDK